MPGIHAEQHCRDVISCQNSRTVQEARKRMFTGKPCDVKCKVNTCQHLLLDGAGGQEAVHKDALLLAVTPHARRSLLVVGGVPAGCAAVRCTGCASTGTYAASIYLLYLCISIVGTQLRMGRCCLSSHVHTLPMQRR